MERAVEYGKRFVLENGKKKRNIAVLDDEKVIIIKRLDDGLVKVRFPSGETDEVCEDDLEYPEFYQPDLSSFVSRLKEAKGRLKNFDKVNSEEVYQAQLWAAQSAIKKSRRKNIFLAEYSPATKQIEIEGTLYEVVKPNDFYAKMLERVQEAIRNGN